MVHTPRTEEYWFNQKSKLYSLQQYLVNQTVAFNSNTLTETESEQRAMGLLATTEGELRNGKENQTW